MATTKPKPLTNQPETPLRTCPAGHLVPEGYDYCPGCHAAWLKETFPITAPAPLDDEGDLPEDIDEPSGEVQEVELGSVKVYEGEGEVTFEWTEEDGQVGDATVPTWVLEKAGWQRVE
jgi:hypothetical protein